MFERVQRFARRHRRKLIAGGVVVAGAYCAYRVALPRIQRWALNKLLEGSNGLLQEIANAAEGGEKKTGPERSEAARLHEQAVADAYARRALKSIRPRLVELFGIDEAKARLTEKSLSKEEKVARFAAFQVECIARSVSTLYASTFLLLLYRVEFNVMGRGMAASDGDAAHEGLLEATRAVEDQVLGALAAACREAVATQSSETGLAPSSSVDAAALERFLLAACDSVDAALLGATSGAAALLLPEAADPLPALDASAKVKAFLDDARDILDSPKFAKAAKAAAAGATRCVVGQLSGLVGSAGAAVPAPLAEGKSCPLATTFGPLMQASAALLGGEHGEEGTELAERFSTEPAVIELCEALDAKADSSDASQAPCPQQ